MPASKTAVPSTWNGNMLQLFYTLTNWLSIHRRVHLDFNTTTSIHEEKRAQKQGDGESNKSLWKNQWKPDVHKRYLEGKADIYQYNSFQCKFQVCKRSNGRPSFAHGIRHLAPSLAVSCVCVCVCDIWEHRMLQVRSAKLCVKNEGMMPQHNLCKVNMQSIRGWFVWNFSI